MIIRRSDVFKKRGGSSRLCVRMTVNETRHTHHRATSTTITTIPCVGVLQGENSLAPSDTCLTPTWFRLIFALSRNSTAHMDCVALLSFQADGSEISAIIRQECWSEKFTAQARQGPTKYQDGARWTVSSKSTLGGCVQGDGCEICFTTCGFGRILFRSGVSASLGCHRTGPRARLSGCLHEEVLLHGFSLIGPEMGRTQNDRTSKQKAEPAIGTTEVRYT